MKIGRKTVLTKIRESEINLQITNVISLLNTSAFESRQFGHSDACQWRGDQRKAKPTIDFRPRYLSFDVKLILPRCGGARDNISEQEFHWN